ncbi:hypothetical protein D3C75_1376800 [compost metagenome]
MKVYEAANQTSNSIKVIMCFSFSEMQKVISVLNELGLSGKENVVIIDASRENKESASNVR